MDPFHTIPAGPNVAHPPRLRLQPSPPDSPSAPADTIARPTNQPIRQSPPNASVWYSAFHMTSKNPPRFLARLSAAFHRLGAAGPLAIVMTCLPAVGTLLLLGVVRALAPWLHDHLVAGLLFYCIGFWIAGGLALLPTYANSGLGGWTFGFALGFPAALAGLLGAALVGYNLSYRITGDRLATVIAESPRSNAVYQSLLNHGFWRALLVITLIRIPPIPPFAATTCLLAAARVPTGVFLCGTLLGIAPRTALVVFAFSKAGTLDFNDPGELWVFAVQLIATAISLAILSFLARRTLAQVTQTPNQP